MKHFSGAKPFASSKAGNPSDTLLRDSKPAPQAARRAVVVKTAGLDDNGYTYQANAAPQHKRVVRTAVAAGEQYVERDPTTSPAAAAHRPAAAAIKPNVSSHRSSRAHQQRSRQLVRVASHSIDLGSDLSSDTDQSDVDAKSPKNASLRQPKHTSQPAGSCPTAAAAAAAAAGSATHPQPQRKQHHKKQGRDPHPDPPPATAAEAAAAAAGGASQGGRTRRQGSQTKSVLFAVASLVLLAACGSTIRAVSGWQRGASNLYRNAATADPSAAAFTIGADVAEGPLDSGSSWLSYTPFATSRQPAPGAAAAAAAGPPGWLPRGWQRFGGQLSSTAQHVLSRMGSARGATGRTSSAHAAPSSSSSEKRPVTAIRAASTGAAAAAASPAGSSSSSGSSTGTAGSIKLYAVVDAGAPSPFVSHSPKGSKGLDWSADWGDVLKHMAQRLEWTDERFNLQVMTQDELKTNAAARQALSSALSTFNPSSSGSSSSTSTSPMFVGIGITDADVAAFLSKATAQLPTALFWNSDPSLGSTSRVDGYAPETAGPFAKLLAQNVGFSKEAKAAEVMKTLDILWGRNTSDDLLYIWLVLLNQYVTPVPMVANTTKGTDLASLYCMIKNCGQKIVDCVSDKTCKGGLDCLQGCAFNDQVCQYRCIVSYETPQFEQFALCILQLHNCRGLNAEIPMRPDPAPMTKWRGQSLTHETAEDLFIGWLSKGPQMPNGDPQLMPYSWLVAAGKNPAYDAFGCQHQLYYRGKGKGQLWYEPVFRVTTLEGQEVWRKRRYRVRRGKTPGTFHYSVLDNGVTSNEYWRIIDCAEDLAYCLFYYSGAASAAGMSYTGAVLGTRDGLWPGAYTERIHGALRQAGIEPWELSMPDNSRCADAPLQPVAA